MRPGASLLTAGELLWRLRAGALRPLPLPRAARWGEAQCIDFLYSITRGLPCGALVLGRGPARRGAVRLGRAAIDAPASPEALWIIDGHQRLGALTEALAAPGEGPTVSVEIGTGKLFWGPADEGRQGELPGLSSATAVPLSTALELPELLRWLRLHPQGDAEVLRLMELRERFLSHPISVYLVGMEDAEITSEIYERANGARLDAVDRFSLRQGAQEESPLSKVEASLQGLGFGSVEGEVILKALRAIAGEAPGRDAVAGLLKQAEAALRRAIVFLQVNGGVVHEALLPYTLPLPVLARFFHEFPRPQAASREALRRWLWRGSLGLSLGGGAGRYLDAIHPGDEEGSAARLLALAPQGPAPEVARVERFNAGHARCRLQLCALASLRPRLPEGPAVDLASLLSTPDLLLPHLVDSEHPLASSSANRALLPPGAGLARALVAAAPEALGSHAIDPEAHEALARGDSEAFLELRAAALRSLFARHFSRQAEWPQG